MIAQPGVWTGTKFQDAVGIKEIELCPWTVLSRADVAKKARDLENNIVIRGAAQCLTLGIREMMEQYMIAVVPDGGECDKGYRCTYLSDDITTSLSAPNVHRGSQHGRTPAEHLGRIYSGEMGTEYPSL